MLYPRGTQFLTFCENCPSSLLLGLLLSYWIVTTLFLFELWLYMYVYMICICTIQQNLQPNPTDISLKNIFKSLLYSTWKNVKAKSSLPLILKANSFIPLPKRGSGQKEFICRTWMITSKFNADGGYYHSHLLLAHSEGCTIYVFLFKNWNSLAVTNWWMK